MGVYNGHMFGEGNNSNNFRDTGSNPFGIQIKDTQISLSYTKTNKLITALYMVTDIMDIDDPLRRKLRTLGADILSDIYTSPLKAVPKILETLAFLDIAGIVNAISDMNANILRTEFFILKKAIEDANIKPEQSYSDMDLADLFQDSFSLPSETLLTEKKKIFKVMNPTSIGVQKGSTLLNALRGMNTPARPLHGSNSTSVSKITSTHHGHSNANHEESKRQRREIIISIIKTTSDGATITDIKSKATGVLASCGEKTLQRELIGMLKDSVLKKTGEKRWSRYFLS